jgi:hypothetical protein
MNFIRVALPHMPDFNEYDNIDRDIIKISRDSLLLLFKDAREYFSSTTAAWGFLGIGISFLSSSILTESFRNLFYIPGETIRAVFIVLGVVTLGFSGYFGFKWKRGCAEFEPDVMIKKLIKQKEPERKLLPSPATEIKNSLTRTIKRVQKTRQDTVS